MIMRYTVNSFIRELIGDYKSLIKSMQGDCTKKVTPILKFNGNRILIYTKESYGYSEVNGCFDSIFATKKGNKLFLDLLANNYWYFTVEFSDGGLIKNRIYDISKAFK